MLYAEKFYMNGSLVNKKLEHGAKYNRLMYETHVW